MHPCATSRCPPLWIAVQKPNGCSASPRGVCLRPRGIGCGSQRTPSTKQAPAVFTSLVGCQNEAQQQRAGNCHRMNQNVFGLAPERWSPAAHCHARG